MLGNMVVDIHAGHSHHGSQCSAMDYDSHRAKHQMEESKRRKKGAIRTLASATKLAQHE